MSQPQVGAAVGTPPGDTFADDSTAEYLKSHPEFFERHPLLLLSLKLPHRTGGAISLVAAAGRAPSRAVIFTSKRS